MGEEDLSGLIERVAGRLHLGAYEREAYLAVLAHGSIEASELADQTDIPQPRVYDTVRNLAERELVELHESRPMRVVAVDPAEAFAGMTSSMEELVDRLHGTYTDPAPDQPAVSLVKSRTTIMRHLGRLIDQAEYELVVAMHPETAADLESNLRNARNRGVSVELILSPATQAPDADAYDYAEIASTVRTRRGRTTPIIGVSDGEQSIYATQDAIEGVRDRYGVLFQRSALGFLLFGFYGTVLWSTAEPIFDTEEPVRFPRQYASVRRCVKEIEDLDEDLYATIEGRWVLSDEACEVTGEIVDTTLADPGHVATLSIDCGDSIYSVGGRIAALEDVEAHRIRVALGTPQEQN